MENDIYRHIIRELINKSEKDFGFKRVENGKIKSTQYVIKVISLLLQLAVIIVISSLFATLYPETSSLHTNLYVVIVGVAVLGVLNSPHLWNKFTRKYIIVIIMLVSVLVALRIFVPSKVIPQISNQLPLFMSWGMIIAIVSFVIFVMSYTVVSLAELLLDLASVFLPVLPTTFGKSLPDLTSEIYNLLYKETVEKETGENELKYLISASQADIDSAGIRSLPWVVLLGFGATSYSEIFKGTISFFLSASSLLGFFLLIIGLFAIFNLARMTYFQALIIQVANRLLIELSKRNSERQENLNNFIVLNETNKSGCLLRILFPWKNSG